MIFYSKDDEVAYPTTRIPNSSSSSGLVPVTKTRRKGVKDVNKAGPKGRNLEVGAEVIVYL